ncbi:hypothetical protein QMK19_31815 [Streptomyces sp. H10-C2]|uniref:hypothetical protein n=1 Tax=unclassified Streptomyces TaxID=2593676 RepID=UPI0024B897B3|nr:MULTISPECIES: hypothetical protein [unclassified Streptomyces]MDJ0345130.1 hypothetical protein [Streptomyces sp. PH10-H1]MDJ0374098.1 hypothetical protein [Streptomyces sp. H10-C2]
MPGQARWRLLFANPVTRQQVETWVFLSGGLPDGFSLTPGQPGGAVPSPAWSLSWADFRSRRQQNSVDFTRTFLDLLTPYGQTLANRALLGGDATDEEVVAWEASQKEKTRQSEAYDRQFVPALGMTRGEALARLSWGPYEVNGQFIWIGIKDARTRAEVETYPVSSNEVFNRDIRFYLRHGLSVSQAVAAFTAQWDYIIGVELAFAGTGAGYRASDAAELESEAEFLERRVARAQGFLSEGDIAAARALSSPESTVIRTELAGQAEIGAVRRAETGAPTAATRGALTDPVATPPLPTSVTVTPGRRVGFAPQSAAHPAPTDAAQTPPAGHRPVAGFARPLEPLSPHPPGATPEQQTYTQLPPARQVSSAPSAPGAPGGGAIGQRSGGPTQATAGGGHSGDGSGNSGTTRRVPGGAGPKAGPLDYSGMSRTELRTLAKTDPDAAYALSVRDAAVARAIAKGHAADHFPELTTDELTKRLEDVVTRPTAKKTAGNSIAYWDEESKTMVIEDPGHEDSGTAFRPDEGRAYFDRWPDVGERPVRRRPRPRRGSR